MPTAGNTTRRQRFSLVLLAGLTVAALTACDTTPPAAAPLAGDTPRQVTVVGSGEVQGTPDVLTASAGVSILSLIHI